MKTIKSVLPILLLLASLRVIAIGNNKTLMVEYFGTNIFRIDEDNNVVFEREVDLLEYANIHGYQNLILKRIDEITYGNNPTILFPKWARAAGYTPTGSAKAKEDSLAAFLHRARAQYNINHIAVADKPYDDTSDIFNPIKYKTNFFFYNVHNFNVRQYAAHGNNNDYCFDMLYGEDDFWTNDGALGNNYGGNWTDYYLRGLRQIDSVKALSASTSYGTLLTGTYIGNLNKVSTHTSTITNQNQVDSIDLHLDWVFLDLYFKGKKINQINTTDTTYEFFHRDRIQGRRIKLFANNSYPSVILPLFASQAADTSSSDFFGDNILNDNGLFFSQDKTEWNGTVSDVKSYFENLYNTVQDPYNDNIPGQSGLTMNELAEDSVTAGNVANSSFEGVGWFKYGTMPDNNVYLLKADTVGTDTATTFTLKPDQLITNGTDNCIKCRGFNYNASSNAQIIAKCWYQDGILITGANDSTLQVNLPANDTIVYTYEITVETPGSGGAFNKLKIRQDIKVRKNVVVGGGCGWGPHWTVTSSTNPTCPNFNNGTVTLDYVCSSCSPSNKTFKWYNSSNTLVLSQNSVTATGLSSGKYRVEIYCGTTYLSHTYVVLHAVDNSPHPTIYSDNDEMNCYASMHINSAYSSYSKQWYRNGMGSGNAISGATGLSYTATQSGTYYVKVTASGGCSGFSAPLVINYAPSPTISGSDITCENNKTYSVAEDPNNLTYHWVVPSGVSTTADGFSSITIISWGTTLATIGGTISCTVTNACGRSTTANFTVKGCCSSGSGDLNNATIISSQTFNTNFHVNGKLTITGSGTTVTIDGADVLMNQDAKIIVNAGCTLKVINAARLHSCSDKMWDGIVVYSTSAAIGLVEVTSGSRIEDAKVAIETYSNSLVHIDNATFNVNHKHLVMYGNGLVNNSYIRNGSVFSCTGGSGNCICLKSPHPSEHTLTAIELHNTVINLGAASGSLISISNVSNGIDAENTNLTFQNGVISAAEKGMSIYGGWSQTIHNSSINSCQVGIESNGVGSFSVHECNFDNDYIGIKNLWGTESNYDIYRNNFTDNFGWAVFQLANNLCTHQIHENIIQNGSQEFAHGIDIIGLTEGESEPLENREVLVYGNELYNTAYGIHLQNITDAHIFDNLHNEVMHTPDADFRSFGILIENCENTLIENNSVSSYGSSLQQVWWSNGIMADNSAETFIRCNSVGNIGRGLWIGGFSPNTTVAGNAMGNCYDQLYLNWNLWGLMDQGLDATTNPPYGLALDNEWVGSVYSAGDGHQTTSYYSNSKDYGGYTLFHTRSGFPYEPTDHQVFDLSGLFDYCNVDVLSNFSAESYCQERPELPEERGVEERIAQGGDFGQYFETFKWMSKDYLLKQSKQDATLAATDLTIANEVTQIEQGNIGKIEAMKDSIINVDIDSTSLSYIQQLQQINSGLQPMLAAEANYKSAHSLSLNYLKNKSLTNGQKSAVRYLSELCPYSAGPGVYTARALRLLFETNIPPYTTCDSYNPVPANRKALKQTNQDVNSSFQLYPSPGIGDAVYTFTIDTKAIALLKVVDFTGRQILLQDVSGMNIYDFKKLHLAEGVYHVQLFVNNQLEDEQNMVVVK